MPYIIYAMHRNNQIYAMHKIDQLTAITPGAGVTKQYASLCGYKFGSATAVHRPCDMHLTFIGINLSGFASICGKL